MHPVDENLTFNRSKPATRMLYACVSSSSCATNAFALVAQVSSYNLLSKGALIRIIIKYVVMSDLNIVEYCRHKLL